MTHSGKRVGLRALSAIGLTMVLLGPAAAWSTAAESDGPNKTTPLPTTTTLEPMVNPSGLTEPAPYGWHADYIGPLRGVFDTSFGVKFWPGRFNFRSLMFGGAVDLAPG